MGKTFSRIGLFSKPAGKDIVDSIIHTIDFLNSKGCQIILEDDCAKLLPNVPQNAKVLHRKEVGSECDLVVVIGGDGSLIKAARAIVDYSIPVIGINRGTLGFLADINPNKISQSLSQILEGDYQEDPRILLKSTMLRNNKILAENLALNDVVLSHSQVSRLIEFEIHIDDNFVLDQRADGLIVSTPTGSTAYSLSGGGPILYPTLEAITLLPKFPHTLSSRPIVVNEKSIIKLVITKNSKINANASYDGQNQVLLEPGDELIIQKHKIPLKLLHPTGYDYFAMLREKLGWNYDPTSKRSSSLRA